MFTDKNILIDENDDNDYSSRNFNQSSRPLNQPTNNNPMIARNLIGSEAKKPSIPSFMNSGNNYDQMSSSPDQVKPKTNNNQAKHELYSRNKTKNKNPHVLTLL